MNTMFFFFCAVPWHLSNYVTSVTLLSPISDHMAPEMSVDLKERIVSWYLNDQLTYRKISVCADCSIRHISNVMWNHWDFSQGQQTVQLSHWPPICSWRCQYQIHIQPSRGQSCPVTRWIAVSVVVCPKHTSFDCHNSQLLARYKLMWKHLQRVASEHDEELWGIWEADMAQYEDLDVFIALDESAVDDQTIQWRISRSMVGSPCVWRAAFLMGTWYSVLPALTTEGIIALDIFEGSVTKDCFLTFIQEQVVCHTLMSSFLCTQFYPFDGPHSSIPIQESKV